MRNLLTFALKAVISGVLLYFAFAHVNVELILRRLDQLRYLWLAAGVLSLTVQILLGALRWQTIDGRCNTPEEPPFTIGNAVRYFFVGIFFNETPEGTPVQITGQSSLAATESAIPIGVEKIEDAPEPEPKAAKQAKAKAEFAAGQPLSKKPAPDTKLTVRRAIVDSKSAKSKGGLGSMFNWTRRPPRGSTIYLQQ